MPCLNPWDTNVNSVKGSHFFFVHALKNVQPLDYKKQFWGQEKVRNISKITMLWNRMEMGLKFSEWPPFRQSWTIPMPYRGNWRHISKLFSDFLSVQNSYFSYLVVCNMADPAPRFSHISQCFSKTCGLSCKFHLSLTVHKNLDSMAINKKYLSQSFLHPSSFI